MIKHLAFKLVRYRVKSYLPKINPKYYKRLFTLSYKFFTFIKPSSLWVITLALLNKTDLKNLISIPSIFILFSSIFSEPNEKFPLNAKSLYTKLEGQGLTNPENKLELFFWVVIILAIVKRFISSIFKFLWIPFKLALIYYVLNYFGFDFNYAFGIINNLTLGVVNWFYDKITDFLNFFNPNDKNN